ncbi:hypothetical protein [Microcoleus sp. herbarium14]
MVENFPSSSSQVVKIREAGGKMPEQAEPTPAETRLSFHAMLLLQTNLS